MITLTRILVPHDFSETSEVALTYASGLAETFRASLYVLHVTDVETDILEDFANGRQRLTKGVTPDEKTTQLGAEFHVRAGTPDVEISRFATDRTVDLIVMGTHGRGVVGHAVMGSVAEKVVRTAPCPVLTLRGPQRESLLPAVLVALDFEAASDTALAYGRALARMFGARLHVLHVIENSFMRSMAGDPHILAARASQQVNDRLTDEDREALHATAIVEMSDTPADAIVAYAAKTRIDLIILGTHGRRAFDRLLMGSVAERVVRTASCPVLTVRHPERDFVESERAPRVSTPAAEAATEPGRPPTGRSSSG